MSEHNQFPLFAEWPAGFHEAMDALPVEPCECCGEVPCVCFGVIETPAEHAVRERATGASTATPAPLKRGELEKGNLYRVRLTDGSWVTGQFLYETLRARYLRNSARYHFVFRNLATGRDVEIKSLQRVREVAK